MLFWHKVEQAKEEKDFSHVDEYFETVNCPFKLPLECCAANSCRMKRLSRHDLLASNNDTEALREKGGRDGKD